MGKLSACAGSAVNSDVAMVAASVKERLVNGLRTLRDFACKRSRITSVSASEHSVMGFRTPAACVFSDIRWWSKDENTV